MPLNSPKMGRGRRESHAADLRGTQGGECVGDIMQSWNIQVYLDDLTSLTGLHSEPDFSVVIEPAQTQGGLLALNSDCM